ncbi:hypothetical protein P691DRAFT_813300 [Macrolepiota fuliginosa MF-IS2]|uniref:Uncharacterized protein n=1 Tax=Macrolepiota fuliginosa MF-IS2 TaxID=1400762 RepID=A0A9P6C2J3_9AGAR|nr:hypothetical protein P691DRAFT_813300 [Macrolepiota fuliginosa MF-IS2]
MFRVTKECKHSPSVTHLRFFTRMIAETGLFRPPITLAYLLAWFGGSGYAADIAATLVSFSLSSVNVELIALHALKNAPLARIASNWFIIRVASNKAEAEKVSISKKISTLRFHEPYIRMEGTNRGMTVSAGMAFKSLCSHLYLTEMHGRTNTHSRCVRFDFNGDSTINFCGCDGLPRELGLYFSACK